MRKKFAKEIEAPVKNHTRVLASRQSMPVDNVTTESRMKPCVERYAVRKHLKIPEQQKDRCR